MRPIAASASLALLVTTAGLAACAGSAETPPRAPDVTQGAEPAPEAQQPTAADTPAPRIVQPGAPGEPGRVISVDEATDLSGIRHTEADVRFMQGMIHHHAQALEMTALVPERSASEGVRLLAQRIDLSQVDEIGMMETWLRARGERVPPESARGHTMMMPGMLSAEEMGRLEAASGNEFDRLFLEGMIKHHGGALIMVDELYATPGAGQEPAINAFASEVVADQRAEMDRMAAMLETLRKEQAR